MGYQVLQDEYYKPGLGPLGPGPLGIRYDPVTGDYQLKGKSALGYDVGIGLPIFYQNGNWTSDAIKDPQLFTNNDPSKPTALANQISEEMRRKVNAAYLTGGGQNKGLKINPTAQNPTGTAGVQNYFPGTKPPVNLPGVTTPPGAGNILDAATKLWNGLGDGFADLSNIEFTSANENKVFTQHPELLVYPSDLLKTKQDTLQVTMYRYQAPKGDLFAKNNNTPDFRTNILTQGIQRNSALKELIGKVILPIPSGIGDSNNVNWGEDNMNNLTAAVTNYVANNLHTQIGGSALAQAGQLAGLPASAITFLGTIGAAAGGSISDPNLLAQLKAPIASLLLKQAGFEVSPESILARGFGIVPNSNMELLFSGPTLRDFTFAYRMSPRSEEEARHVKRIIRFFKQGSAPRKLNAKGGAGNASVFLGTPNVFKLQYMTENKEISGLNKFKICALRSVAVNYAPDGTWAAYDEGQPVSLTMSLNFQEIEPVYESDYQVGISDAFKGKDDYSPVHDDDVGY